MNLSGRRCCFLSYYALVVYEPVASVDWLAGRVASVARTAMLSLLAPNLAALPLDGLGQRCQAGSAVRS